MEPKEQGILLFGFECGSSLSSMVEHVVYGLDLLCFRH